MRPATVDAVLDQFKLAPGSSLIARGLGRSYGDSSLAPTVLTTTRLDHLLDFDQGTGRLRCAAGASLADILDVFVPRGWFLPVTPGTRHVTVGGAVASDVHGKNHHVDGTFTDHVSSLRVATVSDGVVCCSRHEHQELFWATCGGMGLTGVIVEVTLTLRPIQSSFIDVTTIRTQSLAETLELLDEHHAATYSVAWVDGAARGSTAGRSLLMLGEHAPEGGFVAGASRGLRVPVDLPSSLLDRRVVGRFNSLYYASGPAERHTDRVHYGSFFYPLDRIGDWNRLYGRRGFTQYQFVLPRGAQAMLADVFARIAASRQVPSLAVLKAFGRGNDNYLCFPLDGYTLALDFRLTNGLHRLLGELDELVIAGGGRLYLSKDAHMTAETFRLTYPRWSTFREIRQRYRAHELFNSMQSIRLEI